MRPSLEIVVTQGGTELGRWSVARGEYTIGRASTSSITIKVGPVSRQHARMVVEESGAVAVEDLASANGTQLGEEPIAGLTAWTPGEPLRIGDVALHLIAIPPERPLDEFAPTLSPSQAGDYEPAPPSETRTVSGEEAEIIGRHLPLTDRRAQRLDREKEIARGGMGAVLQARESATRRTVAMKIMLRGENTKETLRFIEEAQVTAQLEHPNIVPVHDLGIDEHGKPFYTMKLVAGITLKKVLELVREGVPETVRKYPLATLLTVFQKICDALAFAHSRGVIHRDLKPANIMVGKFGEVLVMDWGLAKIVGTKAAQGEEATFNPELSVVSARRKESDVFSTMAGSVMGTPHYMSPEQARGEADRLDARSDIFTLGVILYEIVTLARPFEGKNAREIMGKIIAGEFIAPMQRGREAAPRVPNLSGEGGGASIRRVRSTSQGTRGAASLPHLPGGRVPESLDAIIRKAMAPDPAARYPRVTALQADLTAYQTGFATSAETRSAWKQLRLLVRRNKSASVATAVILFVILGFTAKLLVDRERIIVERNRAEGTLADLRGTAPAFIAQAKTLRDEGKPDAALEKIAYAIQLAPHEADYHLFKAHLLEVNERLTEAMIEYRSVLGLRGSDPSAARNLALCQRLLKANGVSRALRPEIRRELARVLLDEGRGDDAKPLLRLVGGDPAANEKALRALLSEYRKQPGWREDRFKRTDDGGFYLDLSGLEIGDLGQLFGFPISGVSLGNCPIRDFHGAERLPLKYLSLTNLLISDLAPLRGLQLRQLSAINLPLRDLKALPGMPLERLELSGTAIRDLSPLQGMTLRYLHLAGTLVTDLTPLQGMPLTTLSLPETVTDLSPIIPFPLEQLDVGACKAADLLPIFQLRDLETLLLPKAFPGMEALKNFPKLRRIAIGQFSKFEYRYEKVTPAAEFWAEYDAQQAAGKK